MPRRRQIPKPHAHTGSDGKVRCRLRLDGKDYYCGPWGSPEADAEADRLLSRWLAAHRGQVITTTPARGLTVAELLERFDAEKLRQGDKREAGHCRSVFAAALAVAGALPAEEFGLDHFEAARDRFVAAGWSRGYVLDQCRRLRRIFRWASHRRRGYVSPAVALGLADPDPLPEGAAHETEVREPPSDELVEATLPHLAPVPAAMVRVQRASGMRPAEVCALRLDQLDTSGECWLYEPRQHKTRRHGVRRRIWLGPRAREALAPLVEEARAEGREWVFPVRYIRRPGQGCYTTGSYHQAVVRACVRLHATRCPDCARRPKERLEPWCARAKRCPGLAADRWAPLLLRSARLTEVGVTLGVLHAKATGSHTRLATTAIYLRSEDELAKEAAKKSG